MRTKHLAAAALAAWAGPGLAATTLGGEFHSGMTPQQVVDAAVKIPGVSGAKVKQKKEGIQVDVSHGMYSKFEVAGKKSRLGFTFRDGVLFSVDIKPEPYEFGMGGCIQGAFKAFRYYNELLKTKYERNHAPAPDLSESDISAMMARAKLAALSKQRYSLPTDGMAEGFSDGKVQVINRVRFNHANYGVCGGEGNLHGSNELTYVDKAQFEAAVQARQNDREQTVKTLGRDL